MTWENDTYRGFQFLGIPPKGEHCTCRRIETCRAVERFQFLGIPPKGEQDGVPNIWTYIYDPFPISRDPPEGGTSRIRGEAHRPNGRFPISRDPPEGGTAKSADANTIGTSVSNF